MRPMGALIFAAAITSVSSILNYSPVDAQTNSTTASGPSISSKAAAATADTKDKDFDLSTVSKAIVDEASSLKNDAAGWDQKMQELELFLFLSNRQDLGGAGLLARYSGSRGVRSRQPAACLAILRVCGVALILINY
jgi:hypothetical protein